jgi:hypothetical protein
VCESKEKKEKERKERVRREGREESEKGKKIPKALRAADILSPEFWKDQQRGCLEHCANHPLYARHMIPFFAEIPTGELSL